jgi:hypothetical protein
MAAAHTSTHAVRRKVGVPYPVIFNSTGPSCKGGDAHGRGATCTERPTANYPQW